MAGKEINFPDKKYNIIYCDPPWPIKLISRSIRPKQLGMPYAVMTYQEICDLPVSKITHEEECHLFLWTTHKWLPKAFKVMDEWGFQYNCCITWNKTYGFTPFSFMWSTEFLLYGQLKRKWVNPPGAGKHRTCIEQKPTGHSVKPDTFRRMIVDFCGDKLRIELFARMQNRLFKPEGWDFWGEEA